MIDYTAFNEHPQECLEELGPFGEYLYAPYLIMKNDFSNMHLTWIEYPLLKMMFDVSCLIKYLQKTPNYKELKTFILEYITKNASYIEKYWETKTAIEAYRNVLTSAKVVQYDQKQLESAMINYYPIIDYSGICKMPMMTNENSGENDSSTLTPSNNANMDSMDKRNYLIRYNLFSILMNAIDLTPFNDNDFFDLYNIKVLNEEHQNAIKYYILAYIIYHCTSANADAVCIKLKLIDAATDKIAEEKFNTDDLIAIFSETSTEAITNIEEDKVHLEYETDKLNEKLYDMANLDDNDTSNLGKKYNIYILTNYMYNARRYTHNKYTNAFFINNNKELHDYTYLQDEILVVEIDNEYLCSPVIDLADDYKMKLIRVDRNDVVSIIPLK